MMGDCSFEKENILHNISFSEGFELREREQLLFDQEPSTQVPAVRSQDELGALLNSWELSHLHTVLTSIFCYYLIYFNKT